VLFIGGVGGGGCGGSSSCGGGGSSSSSSSKSDDCSVIEVKVMIVVINTPICLSFYVAPTVFQRVVLLNLRFQVVIKQKFVLAHLVWYVEITLCQNRRSA